MGRRLNFWGWGFEDEAATGAEQAALEAEWAGRFGVDEFQAAPPPTLDEIDLRPPRPIPDSLAGICSTDKYDRVRPLLRPVHRRPRPDVRARFL